MDIRLICFCSLTLAGIMICIEKACFLRSAREQQKLWKSTTNLFFNANVTQTPEPGEVSENGS